MPRVTVILNSFNQSRFLRQSVESVLAQSFHDYELIILDNGSTDDSPKILTEYKGHPRVRLLLRKENRSISSRFNEALNEARGDFISFLYSDDYYLPHKLASQVEMFEKLGADYGVVYSPAQGLNDLTGRRWIHNTPATSGYILEHLLLKYPLDMISPMTRRACFDRDRFNEEVFAEGEAIFFRIALRYKFHFVPQPMAVVRDHGGNAGKALIVNARIHLKSLDRLERDEDCSPKYARALRIHRARLLRNVGWQVVRLGRDMKWARNALRSACRIMPVQALHPRTILGFLMSFLPEPVRNRINAFGTLIRRSPQTAVLVEGYGGGSSEFQ
jgi:alpha-1,3-rhamnosyltransferase